MAGEIKTLLISTHPYDLVREEGARFILDTAKQLSSPLLYDYEGASHHARTAMLVSYTMATKKKARHSFEAYMRKAFIPAVEREALLHQADMEAASFDSIGSYPRYGLAQVQDYMQERSEFLVKERLHAQGQKPLPVPTKKQARVFSERMKALLPA